MVKRSLGSGNVVELDSRRDELDSLAVIARQVATACDEIDAELADIDREVKRRPSAPASIVAATTQAHINAALPARYRAEIVKGDPELDPTEMIKRSFRCLSKAIRAMHKDFEAVERRVKKIEQCQRGRDDAG